MANTLDDLYYKYINRVGKTMENDRYFKYLFAMVQAGSNQLQQRQQILRKIVDERWITEIEDSLDHINNIVDKPRRFIATSEELVPVSLAKKITAASVQHLSMNTQFIETDDEGEIHPSRILNVTTEESYDLYENRFIYHLIHRLIAFVDKRTDVIFWATGDELKNTLSMESSVDDAYEQISYKIEMSIKNTQSYVENDSDNMPVFMRIDRVRRLVFSLKDSAFYSIMNGCSAVHSPIQRTNLMMKDPDYRACYKLWQFLESYDEIGYSINVEESSLEFDEEYMIQMYTNMISNYIVFKSILDDDTRDLVELQKKYRKPVKPKFIKQIKEVIVDNQDLPDVEIRHVFLKEVTQAQLDAETALSEMTDKYNQEVKNREETEEAEAEAQRQIQKLYNQLNEALSDKASVEEQLTKAIEDKVQELKEASESNKKAEADIRSDYERQLADLTGDYQKQLNDLSVDYEKQLTDLSADSKRSIEESAAGYEQQLQDKTNSYETRIKSMQDGFRKEISDTSSQYESQISDIKNTYEERIDSLTSKYEANTRELVKAHDDRIISANQSHQEKIGNIIKKYDKQILDLKTSNETSINKLTESFEFKISKLNDSHKSEIEQIQSDSAKRLETETKTLTGSYNKQIQELTDSYETRLTKLKDMLSTADAALAEATKQADIAKQAQIKAEEKAEGTRLSRYIISGLNGTRRKRNTEESKDDRKE